MDTPPQSTRNDELPKKPLTWVLSILHLIWIIGFMWVGVFFIPQKYRWIWLALMVADFVHWKFAEGECMLSYYEKKAENPDYKLGQDPELTYAWVILGKITGLTMLELRKIHGLVTQLVFIYVVADQTLVYNPMNIDYRIRTVVFLVLLTLTQKYVSFDSFNNIANDLK